MNSNKENGIGVKGRRVIAYTVLIILTFLCLIWFYILVINATRTNSMLKRGFTPLPSTHLIENMINLLFHSTQPVLKGLRNSLIVSALTAVLTTYFSTMTAYAIHTYEFKGRKAFFTFILMVMMIPTQVTALGFIQFMTKLKLINSFAPLVIPAIASPVTFFYLKQYMDSTLSRSLIEAARIDGAGEFRIFNTIALPLMKPAISVQAIFAFVSSWNNYFTPALILQKDEMKTLPILIAELRSADFLKFDMGIVYAMILFSILPVVVVYLILSKNIVAGVQLGGVKE